MAFLRRLLAASLGMVSVLAGTALSAGPVKLVAFGDSLTAGYQLPADAAFPVLLEKALREKGIVVEIANAGVSGDTTAGGLARLAWSVPDGTRGVILELGANDALRGLPPREAEANLDRMIVSLKARGIKVLLAGMLAPRNNGIDYTREFDAIFERLAAKHQIPLYPFFLQGVMGVPGMTLPDQMHPSRAGVEKVVASILPLVEAFVKDINQSQ